MFIEELSILEYKKFNLFQNKSIIIERGRIKK
jgi:hypothetical protein